MRLQTEETVCHRRIALFLQQRNRQEFALRFAHFSAVGIQMQHMEPLRAPFMPEIRLALRDLIGVMREDIVDAAAVQVERFAGKFHADAGAFDMPARIAEAPRALPFQLLIVKLGLREPEHKIEVFLLEVVEPVILIEIRGIEVDIAARDIGIALFEQLLHSGNELRNASGCRLHDFRCFSLLPES